MSFEARLKRANELESGMVAGLGALGFWSARIGGDPMWEIPKTSTKTRAPDIVIFNRCFIEVKESLIYDGAVRLYSAQLRDYVRNWVHFPLPSYLFICASAGSYAGEVGALSLRQISSIQTSSDCVDISLMDLFRVGTYRDSYVEFSGHRLHSLLDQDAVQVPK
jgi:hypothetical protein